MTVDDQSAVCGADGSFSIFIEAGSYTLTSSLDGYQTVTLQNVTVVANETTPVTITLDPVHNEDINVVSMPVLLSIYPNPAKNALRWI
ncbi:MAG: carboxypeptidase regulatory-like domain-containing protein [Candidatus Cloacimonetes bacterium]|nr:carboxypeptidase regulatory-like domain-containing protein [Candidatus Cloacimonadota bacterium]